MKSQLCFNHTCPCCFYPVSIRGMSAEHFCAKSPQRSNSILMPSATPSIQGAPGIASELWSSFPPHVYLAAYCVAAYRRSGRTPCGALHSREPQSSCAASLSLGLPLTCYPPTQRPASVFLCRSPSPSGSSVGGFYQSKRLRHSKLVSSAAFCLAGNSAHL